MSHSEYIGLRSHGDDCLICKEGYRVNQITMDLLLSRKEPEEIIRVYRSSFYRGDIMPTLEDLAIHAEHCDSSMVPDEYIVNPNKYEEGEEERYVEEKARQANKDEDA